MQLKSLMHLDLLECLVYGFNSQFSPPKKSLQVKSESEVTQSKETTDSATPWTVAYQASQPMEFSRQEYWSGLPFPSPGDLPDPGIEPGSPTL